MTCTTCGQPLDESNPRPMTRCTTCDAVERHFATYIKSIPGRRFVARALNDQMGWRKFHKPGVAVLDHCSSSIHIGKSGLVKLTIMPPRDSEAPMLMLNMQPESARDLAKSLLQYADSAEHSRMQPGGDLTCPCATPGCHRAAIRPSATCWLCSLAKLNDDQ